MIDRFINRLRFTEDDVANALFAAGFKLRPEDCMGFNFSKVATILGAIARQQVRREAEKFLDQLVDPVPENNPRLFGPGER